MKARPSAEKRRKEQTRLERQREKAERRKLRKEDRTVGADPLEDGVTSASSDAFSAAASQSIEWRSAEEGRASGGEQPADSKPPG
jgi:hypothetical protein